MLTDGVDYVLTRSKCSRDLHQRFTPRTRPGTLNVGTMLPNESLLVVLHFADYRTLVLAKLSGAPFLRIATKFAEELARRRNFQVTFYTKWITYDDGTIRKSIRYEPGNQPSLAAACEELAEVIGPHAVGKLIFTDNTWNMPSVVIFEAAPPLKYAAEVEIYSDDGAANNSEALMSNFVGTKALRLCLDCDGFRLRQFNWTFLRQESARDLRLIKFAKHWPENATSAVEELVRCCLTLPHRQGGEPLELDFSVTYFSGKFGLRIIELLRDSGRELTFRMKTLREGELVLNERDYTVDVDNNTTRYTSETSGIVVEVKGHYVTIQSTAEVPPKKPRTTEEVLPAIPFVE